MRTRFAVLATVLSALVSVTAPAVASAAPQHNHGLTINATPNPINAGQGVFIYGQLNGSNNAGQTIYLYHRIVPQLRFTLIGRTQTTSAGFYSFIRNEGVVLTNRSWFVRGPNATHSRTVNERVAALVTLAATPLPSSVTTTTPVTGQPILLSGHVTPSHRYEPVDIQEQSSQGTWVTIAKTQTGGGSNFQWTYRWAQPGVYTLRAVFKADPRNITGESDLVTVTIQQKENPAFTITSSMPTVPEGQSVTISGVLYEPQTAGATASTVAPTPEPTTQVTLYGKTAGSAWKALGTTITGTDGSYSFTTSPIHNEVYKVQETLKPKRTTANLYEGVQDVVTINGSASQTASVGETVTLTGTVAPDHTDHVIYLQLQNSDGSWHNVQTGVLASGSTFSFPYTFGQDGTFVLRARIYGGPENVGAASSPVTVTVTGVAPLSTLPTVSGS